MQTKKDDIPNPESDKYILFLNGDKHSYLPSELRLFKDHVWTNKLSRLLLEGVKEADLFTPNMQQVLSSAQYFNIVNSNLKDKCWVLLKYGHAENADTVRKVIKTLMPHVTAHQSSTAIQDHSYKEFGELQCQENHMIQTLDEPRVIKREPFQGVLINKIPASLVTSQLEMFFPGAKQIFISRDCLRADGRIEVMDSKYAFVMYDTEEETEAALERHPSHEITVDGHKLPLINYNAVKEFANGDASVSYAKVMPDKTRQQTILNIRPMLKVLELIHGELTKFIKTSTGPTSRKQRRDMTQRKKDTVRRMAAMCKAITQDTNRRKSKNIPILDTPEETTLWTTVLDAGRKILGREMFNNYMVRSTQPAPGVSVAPRINTAKSLGIPTPQEIAVKKRAASDGYDSNSKRGRWEGAAGGRGAGARGGSTGAGVRGGSTGAGARWGSTGSGTRGGARATRGRGTGGNNSYDSNYGSRGFIPATDTAESYSNGAYQSLSTSLGRGMASGNPRGGAGLLGRYEESVRGRGRGRGARDSRSSYTQDDYSMDYESVSYPMGHLRKQPPPAAEPAHVDLSLILDMKKQISDLNNKLEKVGNAVIQTPEPDPYSAASDPYASTASSYTDPYSRTSSYSGQHQEEYGMYYDA